MYYELQELMINCPDMTTKEKLKVIELKGILDESMYYCFSCSVCRLVARTDDCKDCPIYCQSCSLD